MKECFPFFNKIRIFAKKDISGDNIIKSEDQCKLIARNASNTSNTSSASNTAEKLSKSITMGNNNSNISDLIEYQDTLIGNRNWIRQFKSANDNYKHINHDIVREYSSLSRSASLSSLEDNFDKSSKDILRVSMDNVSGPIIQKIKNINTNINTNTTIS
jgi:hypothetical protein